MQAIKFIHCADIHLGTPFGTAATMPSAAFRLLREAPVSALKKIVDAAIEENVDFVLIAGDVFDGPVINLRDLRFFTSEMIRLEKHGIQCLTICGNHDPLNIWPEKWGFPDNFYLFGSEISVRRVERDGVPLADIVGFSYPAKEVASKALAGYKIKSDIPAIGMLHTAMVSGRDSYVPCSKDELMDCGLDYWALGHVHQGRVANEDNPAIIWSGAPQKLSPNEVGAGGFNIVEVDDKGDFTRRFVIADTVRFGEITVDVSDCPAIGNLADSIVATVRAASVEEGTNLIYRINVKGHCEFAAELRRGTNVEQVIEAVRDILEAESPFIHPDIIDFKLCGCYDMAGMAGDGSLPGDIAAAVLEAESRPDLFAAEVLPDLEPLFSRWKNRRLVELPGDAELASMAGEAAQLLLDRLLEEDG